MANKLWCLLILQFFAWSLYQLWLDGYSVGYRLAGKRTTGSRENGSAIPVRVCLPIDKIQEKTALKRHYEVPENGTVNITEFARHCARALAEHVNDSLSLQGSYLHNNHFCFLVEEGKLNLLYSFSSFEYKVFIYTANFHTPFGEFVYDQKRPMVKPLRFKTMRGKVNYLGYPYSNCKYLEPHEPQTKSICLNDCLRKSDRKALYMYTLEDGGLLNLTNLDRNLTDENRCYVECKRDNCVANFVLSVNSASFLPVHPETNLTRGDEYSSIRVYPTISSFYFWLNFIGLVTLITNISLNRNLSDLADLVSCFVISCFSTENKLTSFLQNFRPNLHFLILVISWIAFKEFTGFLFDDYYHHSKNPTRTQVLIYDFQIEPFSVIICIPVQYIIERPSPGEPYALDTKKDERILSNYTFGEILNLTNGGLDMAVNDLFISIGSQRTAFAWEESSQILFRKCRLPVGGRAVQIFSRCFRREVAIHEPCYQELISVSQLEIGLNHYVYNHEIYSIYLLDKNAAFSAEAYSHTNRFKANKRMLKLVTNCDNSLRECRTRADCLDKCKSRLFLERHHSITTNSIIDLDEITKWNQTINLGLKLDDDSDREIEKDCKRQYSKTGFTEKCSNKVFYESYKTLHFDPKMIKINLYYELMVREELLPSAWKLTLNVVNLGGIIFGATVANLISMLFAPIKLIFRVKKASYFKHVTLLVCSVGLFVHSCVIFNDIISSELIPGSYFVKDETINFPDIVFCFEMPNEADPNHKLTGGYLNGLDELRFESVFDRISYRVNGSFTDLRNITQDASYDVERKFRFFVFHYHRMKCFEISSILSYQESELLFDPDPHFLKVYFRQEFIRSKMNVYYFCKNRMTEQFSEIYKLKLWPGLSYKVKLELLTTEQIDKFKYFKNPSMFFYTYLLFYNPLSYSTPSDYIKTIKNDFLQRFGYSTNLVPLLSQEFDYELQNLLFEQYYLQYQKKLDDFYKVDVDFEHQMYNNRISFQFAEQTEPAFAFTQSLYITKTVITNEESYALLIQNLFNLLSLWLNISVLEMPLHRLFSSFSLIHKILTALRANLKRTIENAL